MSTRKTTTQLVSCTFLTLVILLLVGLPADSSSSWTTQQLSGSQFREDTSLGGLTELGSSLFAAYTERTDDGRVPLKLYDVQTQQMLTTGVGVGRFFEAGSETIGLSIFTASGADDGLRLLSPATEEPGQLLFPRDDIIHLEAWKSGETELSGYMLVPGYYEGLQFSSNPIDTGNYYSVIHTFSHTLPSGPFSSSPIVEANFFDAAPLSNGESLLAASIPTPDPIQNNGLKISLFTVSNGQLTNLFTDDSQAITGFRPHVATCNANSDHYLSYVKSGDEPGKGEIRFVRISGSTSSSYSVSSGAFWHDLAVSPSCTPWVVYSNRDGGDLKLAKWNGAGFDHSVVVPAQPDQDIFSWGIADLEFHDGTAYILSEQALIPDDKQGIRVLLSSRPISS